MVWRRRLGLLALFSHFRFLLLLFADDAGDGDEFIAFVEIDELDALGVAAGNADVFTIGADGLALRRREHDLIRIGNAKSADNAADFVGGLHRDDALAATALDAVFVKRRAFADAVFAGDEQRSVGIHDFHADHIVTLVRTDAPVADGGAAHVARFFFVEPDAHAVLGDEDDLVVAAGEFDADEAVALFDPDADDAAFARVGVFTQIGFLHDTDLGRH